MSKRAHQAPLEEVATMMNIAEIRREWIVERRSVEKKNARHNPGYLEALEEILEIPYKHRYEGRY